MKDSSILHLSRLTQVIEGHTILDDVELDFSAGQIHCILGQNGSGKSTLLNILGGLRPPHRGTILINDKTVSIKTPRDAMEHGIRFSSQEDSFVPDMSVAENMLFCEYACAGGQSIVFKRKNERRMQALLDELQIHFSAKQLVRTLNFGQRQMLKIACLFVSHQPLRIVIMDEPYRSCSSEDCKNLYACMRKLKASGVTVIFSSHRIEEALAVSDTVTLLCHDGKVEQRAADSVSLQYVLSKISTSPITLNQYPTLPIKPGNRILEMRGVSTCRIDNVSLDIRRGEILGLAGLLGSGRTGVARALCGLDKLTSGYIRYVGETVRIGVLLCHGSNMLLETMDLPTNITVSSLETISTAGVLHTDKERKIGYDYCNHFNIRPLNLDDSARILSAGNRQKLLLARLFYSNCRLLILDEPTMNIDIVSQNDIYNLMNSYVCQGNSILLITSNLSDLIGVSHRIVVMKDRGVVHELAPSALTYESLLS